MSARRRKILITPRRYIDRRNAFGFMPGPNKHEHKPRHAALPALREAYAVHAINSETGRASELRTLVCENCQTVVTTEAQAKDSAHQQHRRVDPHQ